MEKELLLFKTTWHFLEFTLLKFDEIILNLKQLEMEQIRMSINNTIRKEQRRSKIVLIRTLELFLTLYLSYLLYFNNFFGVFLVADIILLFVLIEFFWRRKCVKVEIALWHKIENFLDKINKKILALEVDLEKDKEEIFSLFREIG